MGEGQTPAAERSGRLTTATLPILTRSRPWLSFYSVRRDRSETYLFDSRTVLAALQMLNMRSTHPSSPSGRVSRVGVKFTVAHVGGSSAASNAAAPSRLRV